MSLITRVTTMSVNGYETASCVAQDELAARNEP